MTEPLSPEREQQIRARHDAATGGLWLTDPDGVFGAGTTVAHVGGYEQLIGSLDFGQGEQADADREFVLNARSDATVLLAELDRLRAKVAAVTALLPDEPTEDINASWIPPRRVRMALNVEAVVPAAGAVNR